MNVLVYCDEGVSSFSLKQAMKSLSDHLSPSYSIRPVSHRELMGSNWEISTALLVMPGGRDMPYQAALQGEGNERIATYVRSGGSYLGLCAGAYYASAFVEFSVGSPIEVTGKRELAFFPGKTLGPAYGSQFAYAAEVGARNAFIESDTLKEKGHIYFNGGCIFECPEQYSNTEVLATYCDIPSSPAAIVLCNVGRGRAVLSGVHPEFSSRYYKGAFQPDEAFRMRLWEDLLKKVI